MKKELIQEMELKHKHNLEVIQANTEAEIKLMNLKHNIEIDLINRAQYNTPQLYEQEYKEPVIDEELNKFTRAQKEEALNELIKRFTKTDKEVDESKKKYGGVKK